MTNQEIKSPDRVLQYSEVFTPPDIINQMLDLIPQRMWEDPLYTFFEPSAGHGNFLIAIFKRRLNNGIDPLAALRTLISCELLQDNVEESKARLVQEALQHSGRHVEIKRILDENIKQGEFLQIIQELELIDNLVILGKTIIKKIK